MTGAERFHVSNADRVLSLLARSPGGLTSKQLSQELGMTSDGASRTAQYLYTKGRISREFIRALGQCPKMCIWKEKE